MCGLLPSTSTHHWHGTHTRHTDTRVLTPPPPAPFQAVFHLLVDYSVHRDWGRALAVVIGSTNRNASQRGTRLATVTTGGDPGDGDADADIDADGEARTWETTPGVSA